MVEVRIIRVKILTWERGVRIKNGQKNSDVFYGRPPIFFFLFGEGLTFPYCTQNFEFNPPHVGNWYSMISFLHSRDNFISPLLSIIFPKMFGILLLVVVYDKILPAIWEWLKPNYFKKQRSSNTGSKWQWSTQQASSMHLRHETTLMSIPLPFRTCIITLGK